MITKFNYFLITEIADTVVTPNIIQRKANPHDLNWTYWIQVKERIYLVRITLNGVLSKCILKVDFMLEEGAEYSAVKTNDGDALLVMANIIAVIKYWLSNDADDTANIIGLWINSKSEEEGDARRSKMYQYYLHKTLQQLGITVKEEKDITDKWNQLNSIEQTSEKYIFMQYEIEPITVGEIKKRL